MLPRLLLPLVLLVGGCSLESSVLSPEDGAVTAPDSATGDGGLPRQDAGADVASEAGSTDAARDTGGLDSSSGDAGPTDTGLPDTGLPDTGLPDTRPPDTGLPDTGLPDTGRPPCDGTFSSVAPGYVFCAERDMECEFYVASGGTLSCAEICGMVGRACSDSYSEAGSALCTRSASYGCDYRHGDGICICER